MKWSFSFDISWWTACKKRPPVFKIQQYSCWFTKSEWFTNCGRGGSGDGHNTFLETCVRGGPRINCPGNREHCAAGRTYTSSFLDSSMKDAFPKTSTSEDCNRDYNFRSTHQNKDDANFSPESSPLRRHRYAKYESSISQHKHIQMAPSCNGLHSQ